MPDAIAPSRPGLGCAGAAAAGATLRDTSRSFLSWLTSTLRRWSLSSVAITLSSERASSAWLTGDGADAASAADAPEAADAADAEVAGIAVTVALLIRLCKAGITGMLAALPAACACAGIQPTHRSSATQKVAANAPKRATRLARSPGAVRSVER